MTYLYPYCVQSTLTLTISDKKEQQALLRNLRHELLMRIFHQRSTLCTVQGQLTSLPICPICGSPLQTGEMHEAIVTRGDAQGCGFQEFLRIFVPENCVLVHPGRCHEMAQWEQVFKDRCANYIIGWQGRDSVISWLDTLSLAIKEEKIRYVQDLQEA